MFEIICTCQNIQDGNMVECEVCKEWVPSRVSESTTNCLKNN